MVQSNLKIISRNQLYHTDFESVLKGFQSNDNYDNASYTKKYQKHIPCSFAYEVVCINDRLSKPVVLCRRKMQSISLLKQFLKKMSISKNDKKSILRTIVSYP